MNLHDGGLAPDCFYLVEGSPGTGKTTFALQFLRAGAALQEPCLYIALSETASELRTMVASAWLHGWTLEGIAQHEMVGDLSLAPEEKQSVLLPSEIELGETIKRVVAIVESLNPARVVFDSLSEIRLLADEPVRYRRQILALKHFFSQRSCTVMLLDDKTHHDGDAQLHSIADGVISLTQNDEAFGIERGRLRVIKMRGISYQGGSHDFRLATGGLKVYPRPVAGDDLNGFDPSPQTTGSPGLDSLLGGGLFPGTNTLVTGPSGIGKTTTAVSCMLAALNAGMPASYFVFEEGRPTLLQRSRRLGMDLRSHLASGLLELVRVDPGETSPGEFAMRAMDAVPFKFTPSEGRVTVRIDAADGEVQFAVEDNGLGIAPTFLPFVFDRFRQSDASTTRLHGGLGLGLAIVKNLVELHGGTVQAHSDGPGHGACFKIRLPAAVGSLFDAKYPAGAAALDESPGATPSHDLSGTRILVVDDEPDLSELLQRELEDCGAVVYAVGSSAEAMELVVSHRPHLLITDIGMPDEDGHALLRRIRGLGPHAGGDIPAIALTAFAGPECRTRALASGFAAHIAKPVDLARLLDEVVKVLSTTHMSVT